MIRRATSPKIAFEVFTPEMDTINSFELSRVWWSARESEKREDFRSPGTGSESSFLIGLLSKSERTKSPTRRAAIEEETPGSQATREPAALPVKTPLRILFLESSNLEMDFSGISEPVKRLIINWDAPEKPAKERKEHGSFPEVYDGSEEVLSGKSKKAQNSCDKEQEKSHSFILIFCKQTQAFLSLHLPPVFLARNRNKYNREQDPYHTILNVGIKRPPEKKRERQ